MGRYQKGKTNLDFTEARDSEWQSHQLVYMQVCTLIQTDNHASTSPLSFLQAGCPSCRPTNSVKALKAHFNRTYSILACAYPRTLLLMNTLSLTSRTIEEDEQRCRQLVDGVRDDVAPHDVRQQRLVAAVRLAHQQLLGRLFGRQCQRRQRVHDEVDPQHLNRFQRRVLHTGTHTRTHAHTHTQRRFKLDARQSHV